MRKTYKYILKLFVLCAISLFLLIVISQPNYASWWVKNVSSIYHKVVGGITNNIPFSIFEIIVSLLIFVLCSYLIKLIRACITKRKLIIAKQIYNISTFCIKIILVYTAISGVGYHRESVDIPLYNENVSDELVNDAISYFLNDYNALSRSFKKDDNHVSICPYSFEELSKLMNEEMQRLNVSPYFIKTNITAKKSVFSPILSKLHITGINFAFTSEASINSAMPKIDLPFTIAHEMAHIKGVMREDDANLTALYICLTSKNDYIRYSGYFRGFYSLLEIKQLTNYKEYSSIVKNISEEILYDNYYYSQYFAKHDLLNNISKFFNNLYLKFNGQKDGIYSYDDTSKTEDTNEKDEYGNAIYKYIEYSPYQKLMFNIYKQNE